MAKDTKRRKNKRKGLRSVTAQQQQDEFLVFGVSGTLPEFVHGASRHRRDEILMRR